MKLLVSLLLSFLALKALALKGHKSALLVIDVQNCFLPGGSLHVNEGETIISLINQLRNKFEIVAFTRDWHPQHHVSFASHHEG